MNDNNVQGYLDLVQGIEDLANNKKTKYVTFIENRLKLNGYNYSTHYYITGNEDALDKAKELGKKVLEVIKSTLKTITSAFDENIDGLKKKKDDLSKKIKDKISSLSGEQKSKPMDDEIVQKHISFMEKNFPPGAEKLQGKSKADDVLNALLSISDLIGTEIDKVNKEYQDGKKASEEANNKLNSSLTTSAGDSPEEQKAAKDSITQNTAASKESAKAFNKFKADIKKLSKAMGYCEKIIDDATKAPDKSKDNKEEKES